MSHVHGADCAWAAGQEGENECLADCGHPDHQGRSRTCPNCDGDREDAPRPGCYAPEEHDSQGRYQSPPMRWCKTCKAFRWWPHSHPPGLS